MELKDQVSNYEQGVKFEELEVKLDSLYNWYMDHNPGGRKPYLSDYHGYEYDPFDVDWDKNKLKKYNAYTVAELIEMLPSVINKGAFTYHLKIKKSKTGYRVSYRCESKGNNLLGSNLMPLYNDFVFALADMLIWLLENNHIKVSEINQ